MSDHTNPTQGGESNPATANITITTVTSSSSSPANSRLFVSRPSSVYSNASTTSNNTNNNLSVNGNAMPPLNRNASRISFTRSPEQVGCFQLGNCIGKGAFASVYRALNLENGNIVALKKFDRTRIAPDLEQWASLQREIELLKQLCHPNIVSYYDCIMVEGNEPGGDKDQQKTRSDNSSTSILDSTSAPTGSGAIYIVLEYVENGSLLSSLKTFSGHFPERLVSVYTRQILNGLAFLHAKGVVHCDIKAANLLTTKTGVLKLSDFGVSRQLALMNPAQQQLAAAAVARSIAGSSNSLNHAGSSMENSYDLNATLTKGSNKMNFPGSVRNSTTTSESAGTGTFGAVVGTPYWMAPEIIELRGAIPSSDIWSLGCTVIELITGSPPFFEQAPITAMFRIVEEEDPASVMIPAGVSNELRDFLRRCLVKKPENRATAQQLLAHPFVASENNNRLSTMPSDNFANNSPSSAPVSTLSYNNNSNNNELLRKTSNRRKSSHFIPSLASTRRTSQISFPTFKPEQFMVAANFTATVFGPDEARNMLRTIFLLHGFVVFVPSEERLFPNHTSMTPDQLVNLSHLIWNHAKNGKSVPEVEGLSTVDLDAIQLVSLEELGTSWGDLKNRFEPSALDRILVSNNGNDSTANSSNLSLNSPNGMNIKPANGAGHSSAISGVEGIMTQAMLSRWLELYPASISGVNGSTKILDSIDGPLVQRRTEVIQQATEWFSSCPPLNPSS